ncbi:hypothetical protein P4H39_30080 [Paenibacillus lautus]|uniref:hypothetical protein n=1 Tax=Paenibacillus lautus TaxID=1401 RepID=UPI002DBD10CF|nr:hypothetical protein [Paenibacillus lautus]MEC0206864.1 hypothetical protein [Paenibacillus lautus]
MRATLLQLDNQYISVSTSDFADSIRKELNEHPDITSIQLAEKYRIPLHIVQMMKDKLLKGVDRTPLKEHE